METEEETTFTAEEGTASAGSLPTENLSVDPPRVPTKTNSNLQKLTQDLEDLKIQMRQELDKSKADNTNITYAVVFGSALVLMTTIIAVAASHIESNKNDSNFYTNMIETKSVTDSRLQNLETSEEGKMSQQDWELFKAKNSWLKF